MKRIYRQVTEDIIEFYRVTKGIFYDSYTGIKKKRVVIAISGLVVFLGVVVLFVKSAPKSALTKMVTEKVVDVVSELAPNNVGNVKKENEEAIKTQDGYVLFEKPIIEEDADVDKNEQDTGIIPSYVGLTNEELEEEWEWKDRWSEPVLHDIESVNGEDAIVTEKEEVKKETKKETNKETKSGTKKEAITEVGHGSEDDIELQSNVLSKIQDIQDVVLLQIHNKEIYSDWSVYVTSARSKLIGLNGLSEQINTKMTKEVKDTWNSLQEVYGRLYDALYACESQSDLDVIAVSEDYRKALEYTDRLNELLDVKE